MPETIQETNGNVSLPRVGRAPKDEGRGSSIPIDKEHRDQLDQWVAWYYPGARANLSDIIHEMMDLAYGLGEADNQRAETLTQRRERLMGKGRS